MEAQSEIAAIRAHPYDEDPELTLPAATPPTDLPYDGDVPDDILALTRRPGATT